MRASPSHSHRTHTTSLFSTVFALRHGPHWHMSHPKKKRSFQKIFFFRPGTFAMWHRKHRLLCSYFHFSTFSPICKVTQTEKKTFFQPIGENHQNGPRPGQPDLFNVLLNLGSSHTRAALFRQMPYDKRPGREKCATVVRTVMCHGKCPFLKFSAF